MIKAIQLKDQSGGVATAHGNRKWDSEGHGQGTAFSGLPSHSVQGER